MEPNETETAEAAEPSIGHIALDAVQRLVRENKRLSNSVLHLANKVKHLESAGGEAVERESPPADLPTFSLTLWSESARSEVWRCLNGIENSETFKEKRGFRLRLEKFLVRNFVEAGRESQPPAPADAVPTRRLLERLPRYKHTCHSLVDLTDMFTKRADGEWVKFEDVAALLAAGAETKG